MRRWAWVGIVAFALAIAGCAGGGGSGGGETKAASAPAAPAKKAPPKGAAPPRGTKMAKVTLDMTPEQVRTIMGAPTGEGSYPTGKVWIPFYFGSDASRTEWKYKGQGRVVFSNNRWSGSQKVVRIDYDPSEDGH